MLVSPCCRARLDTLACTRCGKRYSSRGDVPVLLDERSPAFAAAEARYANGREPWDYANTAPEVEKYELITEAAREAVSSRDDVIADIGCSSGFLAERLTALSDRVVAFDLSATAAARVKARAQDKLIVAAASALALPLPDASVRVAVLSDGLVSWGLSPDERLRAVAEAHRVLVPGGTAVFMEYLNPSRHHELSDAVKTRFSLNGLVGLDDRLWYVSESMARALRGTRLYRAFDRSRAFSKTMKRASRLLGRHGSKHVCAIVQRQG